MDLSEMVQASVFIQGVAGPPVWNWAGSYAVPNATIYRHKCDGMFYVIIVLIRKLCCIRKIDDIIDY
jgi:hypothetical protein